MQVLIFIAYICLALLILLVMITIHELGHYIAAKALKFKVVEFAIGFGPVLFKKVSKKTGEIFTIRAIPLGGFCAFEDESDLENGKFLEAAKKSKSNSNATIATNGRNVFGEIIGGEEDKNSNENHHSLSYFEPDKVQDSPYNSTPKKEETEEEKERKRIIAVNTAHLKSYNDQPPWKRIIVLLAGGIFNLISAVLFSFIFILAVGLPVQPSVTFLFFESEGQIFSVDHQNETYFKTGDAIVEINGRRLTHLYNIHEALSGIETGTVVDFVVQRRDENGNLHQINVSLTSRQIVVDEYNREILRENLDESVPNFPALQFGFLYTVGRDNSLATAITYSVPYTGRMAWTVLGAFGRLVTGQISFSEMSGPVGTISFMAQASAISWQNIFILLPLLAANLGIFNLLPIPALDGSKIVFASIEWIRKKPINRKVETIIHLVGMALLFGFVIVADIVGIFTACGV